MHPISIETVAQILGASVTGRPKSVAPANETLITGICTDSRAIQPGDCFFAIEGERFDGHDYVAHGLGKGAACAVVGKPIEGEPPAGFLLQVPNTVRALGDLARAYRRMHPFKVVAITGSVGKTTTRQIVHHVLSRHFRVRQARKNFNNEIGLPLTLLAAEPTDQIVVAELGANHPGEIAYLASIAQPDIAVVTNAHPAHLEGFGNLATIIREKLSIARGLSETGFLLVNGDIEPIVAACRESQRPFHTFGRTAGVDYRAENIVGEALHSTFLIGNTSVRLPLPGPGNVENALAAWAICERLGLTVEDFARAIEDLTSVAMRAERVQIGALTVLNDCYNANPASMKNALAMLRNIRTCSPENANRRLVFICGPMAELGSQTEALHAELGKVVAEAGVDLLVTVGQPPRITARVARQTAQRQLHTKEFDDTLSVCDGVQDLVGDDDIILVKGSRTARLERVVEKLSEDTG